MGRYELLKRVERYACQRGGQVAVVDVESGESWKWAELRDAARGVSKALGGLAAGTVVMLCGENEPAFIAGFLGILGAGLKAFCVSPACAEAELAVAARESGAGGIVGNRASIAAVGGGREAMSLQAVREGRRENVDPARWREGGGLLLSSSGTMGKPKIVVRSAASLDAVSEAMCAAIGFGEEDWVMGVTPLCHSYGLEHGLLAPMWGGSGVRLCRRFDVGLVLRELQCGVSIFPGVPFMFEALGRMGEGKCQRLRRAYSAGGALSAEAAEEFARKMGVGVGQVYGTSEIGSVTFGHPGGGEGNVGRGLGGVEISIDGASGEVGVLSPWAFEGYLGEERKGAFFTGDLGHLDAGGNLFITGRLKTVIDIGGRKVNPAEVESVLGSHPAVDRCVVVGMKVGGGMRLKAVVTPRHSCEAPTAEELRRFIKARLAGYKVPRVFEVREALAVSSTGKVLRHLIQE